MKNISHISRVVLTATVLAAAALSSQAAPYASSLTNNAGVISFRLNETANSVAIIFTNLSGTLVTSNLGARVVGLTVTNLFVPGNFTVSVTNAAAPGYVSGLTLQTSNDQTNGTPATGIATNTLRFPAPRGVAVNLNPSSSFFGRVYVANAVGGAATRAVGDGIYVLNADYSDAVGQGTNARTAGITAFTNTIIGTTDDGNTPFRLEVGEDSNLYITDFSTNNGTIFVTDPNVLTGTNVLAGFGVVSLGAPNASANHGRIGSSVIAKGSLAGGNLVIYALDSDNTVTTDGGANHIMKWDIGAGPLPVDLAVGTVATNVDNATLLPNAGIIQDLATGPDGKFYLAQNRNVGNEGGVFVVDPAVDGSPFNPTPDGLWDEVYDSRADSVGSYGAAVDILLQTRAVKVSPDGKYMAVIRDDNQLWVIRLVNGLPDLSTRKLVATTPTTTLGRDVAFDAANNLYTVSSGQALMRTYSPGYKSIAQTKSQGINGSTGGFLFTNILPANIVTVVGTSTNASEPSTPGQFTFSRTGDTTQPLTVNYNITGTASRGLDYQTNGAGGTAIINGLITFAAGASATNVDIVVIDDSIGEAVETIIFTLVATTNYISGGTIAATAFIADDGDLPQVSVANRGSGSYELIPYRPGKFLLSTLSPFPTDVNVICALSGTAVSGTDYTNSVLVTNTILAGSTTVVATVTPIDNGVIAADKTIIMTLVADPSYSTNAAAYAATNLLRNDDLVSAPTLFADDFDVDHTANWVVKSNTNDVFTDIFFDYSTVGIPSAPHSVGATTRGMKLKAHLSLPSTLVGVSVSPAGQGFTGDYRLRFDMWYNFNGPLDATGTGSTELLFAGVGGNENRTNGPFGVAPGAEVYFAVSPDAGFGAGSTASRDFGAYTNNVALDPALANVNIWPAGTGTTARDNANAYYAEFGDVTASAAQLLVFPNQIRTNAPGGMGMSWHDVIITKTSTNVTWSIDGLLICTVITTNINAAMSTNIFFAYDDPNTGSLPDTANAIFGLIDNVKVEQLVSAASTNALLSALSISPGTFAPAFASGTTNYGATNAYASNPVTLTATKVDANATLQISLNGGAFLPLTNGAASLPQTLKLNPALNTLVVKVTAQDTNFVKTYTVNVKLLPSQTVPVLTNSYTGSALAFSWAADHVGYRLQAQTNDLSTGLSATWFALPSSDLTNAVTVPVNPANPTVFYRLIYP
jgi:hypothetical protein